MVVPEFGGCLWPIDSACMTDAWEALDPSVQNRSIALASATLSRLTGYRVGNCPVTVRPCKQKDSCGVTAFTSGPLFRPSINASGEWINSCGCVTDCACDELCVIELPAPVGRIDQVKIDGIALLDTQYRLDNGNELVWMGDGCGWPACQDMKKDDLEVGTFSVTYLNAYPVDSLGAYAAGVLAMEYAKACAGNKCRLPSGVTNIVRQGVSMEVTAGSFPGGFTGIHEVDSYISLWNPDGLRQRPTAWWPGKKKLRTTRTF